ncbi:hypothetical protein VTK26DRAFT_7458 [Humicola hyalothermophila]
MTRHQHICGFYFQLPNQFGRRYLPQVSVSAYTQIVSSTSRTTLTQIFVNPKPDQIPELRYTFPLYDGVSVVGFVCTINDERVIRGIVKERAEARKTYQQAVDRGMTAGLLEQLPDASDVFTTTVGNVPANASIKVEITYLGELKNDMEVDGIRFTIPTNIAPRYGTYPGELLKSTAVDSKGGINIVVDVEMPDGCNVKNVQSPSHPISVTVGSTSKDTVSGAAMSLQKASATLALGTAELSSDFVLQVVATGTGNPIAVLETHPTIPGHRALMTTLVPKFSLPSSRPEIVFLCDRSGSMASDNRIPNLKAALNIFLKSLPIGVKFNICSFGSRHELLFPDGSKNYDASSLEIATHYVNSFAANFGGTEMYRPMEEIFEKRYTDMDLEVFLLTDGETWNQQRLFEMINKHVGGSHGAIRVFTLGIGREVSHALIEGVARAGNGFAQTVGDNENMNSKVVRMLKASLSPHIKDYNLEIKYHNDSTTDVDEDFELVEKVLDSLTVEFGEPQQQQEKAAEQPKKTISLFDESVDPDVEMVDASVDTTTAGGKYSHVPSVPEPKILQAPFVIPPLFPFTRTSVYLLLSPETAQKRPKSVVLRGTSPVGPVELEVPVTVLAEKAETIHQLAARKAVKELEEGRGWIYHAKEASEQGTQVLLRDKYPGRFNDMVEREAVRLGVTYQVGGKWCSFVAVEGDKEQAEPEQEAPPAYYPASLPQSSIRFRRALAAPVSQPYTPMGAGGSLFMPAAATAPRTFSGPSTFGGLNTHQAERFSPMTLGAAVPPPPRFAQMASSTQTANVFGGPAQSRSIIPPPAPPAAGHGLTMAGEAAETEEEESDDAGLDFRFMIAESQSKNSLADRLNALVALQSFSGSWAWTDALAGLLGMDRQATEARAAAAGLAVGNQSELLATGLVLAYLELRLREKKDEWEMLADKAKDWLEEELSRTSVGVTSEAYLLEARKLLV